MTLHRRFDTFRICPTYASHSSLWLRLSTAWSIARDGRHETRTSATLEIFGLRGRAESSSSAGTLNTSWWPSWTGVSLRLSAPATHWRRGCWREWKKFPSAVHRSRNSHAKNLFGRHALLIFRFPVYAGCFYKCSFPPPPPPVPLPLGLSR